MLQKITVIVPVYNNESTVFDLAKRVFLHQSEMFPNTSTEILFVNDGSIDGSWEELLKLNRKYGSKIKLLNLIRNFGQLGALHAGFRYATGDAVICISADLQDPVELMSKMVQKWQSGDDLVVAYRAERKDGFLNRLFSALAYAVARITYPELPHGGFDYWLMSRRICQMMASFQGRHNFIQGYLLSISRKKSFIPYTRLQRRFGKSGYKFGKKLKIVIDFMVDTSYLPIRFMSVMGALLAGTGMVYSLLIFYAWLTDKTPFSGWAPLMIMLMVIGGIILLMLGVIGEYVWRIYDNSKAFPLFLVHEQVDVVGESNQIIRHNPVGPN